MKKRLSLFILIAIIIALLLPSIAFAVSNLTVSDKITLTESVANAGFGFKTALYGDTLAVLNFKPSILGLPGSDNLNLYIYDLSRTNPQIPIETINLDDMLPYGLGGYALAVSDNYLLVGIPQYSNGTETACGAVCIFNLNDPNVQDSKILLTEPTPEYSRYFGQSVAIYGDNIVVGGDAFTVEPTYIYSLSQFNHAAIAASAISVESENRHFGQSVGIYKNKVVVCTDTDQNSDTGTAYLYDLNEADVDGSEIALRAVGNDSTHNNDKFGTAVAISEDWLAVSSKHDGNVRSNSGRVYIYSLNADNIAGSQEVIISSDARSSDYFGLNLSISGDLLLVSAYKNGSGAVYIYNLSASDIAGSELKLTPTATDAAQMFGSSAALFGKQIVAGDPYYNDSLGVTDTGAVYYTSLSEVSLNKDGGTGGDDYIFINTGNAMPSATAPTRIGYTFGGYFTDQNGGGTQYYNADMSSAKNWDFGGDSTLYAKWTANQYTVTFDKQYGAGGDNDALATYDSEMPSLTAPSKIAFSFAGYFSEPYGKGTKYYNADMSSAHTWDSEGGITLYAYWESVSLATYTVTFDSAGGSAVNSQVVTYGNYASKPNNPSKSGFSFDGWFTTSGADEGTEWSFDICQVLHDTVLYAKWITPAGSSVTDIEFDYAYKSVRVGSSSNIASICPYTVYPSSATDKTVQWSSSNTNVATISGDVLTAHAEGKTVITVEAIDTTNGTIKTKMIVEVMDATVVSLNASGKDIVGQVVDPGGAVLTGYCVTTYSDPLNTLTNSSGEFVFKDIPYTHHTLVISNNSGQEIGRFSLNFTNTGKQGITVNNLANTANINYAAGTNFVDLRFQVNGALNDIDIISSDISGTNMVANPKTGTITSPFPMWLIALIPLLWIALSIKKHFGARALSC